MRHSTPSTGSSRAKITTLKSEYAAHVQSVLLFILSQNKIAASRPAGKIDEKLEQTISLSLKRIQTKEKEMVLLSYSLMSARIFFRADQVQHALSVKQVTNRLIDCG